MNEKIKQAQETLLKLSGLALKYLVDNFNYNSNEYVNLKLEIGNLTDQIRTALNDFDKYHESQQDLIKGKDEYIAKLCNDRAELKEHEKELIAEQHRLFDLAKELKRFVYYSKGNGSWCSWLNCIYLEHTKEECENCKEIHIQKAPQSWCYIEGEND